MDKTLRLKAAAAMIGAATSMALADPPPLVFDQIEFLPAFSNHQVAQVTSVNNNGDLCGWFSFAGATIQDFSYYGNQPIIGTSGFAASSVSDNRVTVGSSSTPRRAFTRSGQFSTNLFTNRSFTGVNNKGWIVGSRWISPVLQIPVRRDSLGETDLPDDGFTNWTIINDEGTVYGTSRGQIVLKTISGPLQNLGSFGSESAGVRHVNRHGSIAGHSFAGAGAQSVGLAVIEGLAQRFASETGNGAGALAVTLDGQVIGMDQFICTPNCRGKGWVIKNGVRHDLATEIGGVIGVAPEFVTVFAASETGWIIASGFDMRDNSYHLIRIKIQVDIDTDGDGLLDFWELPTGGIDGDQDGDIDFRPYDLGARVDHKDLFVEVDTGTIPMSDLATAQVLFAFDNAPVENPDGVTGIHLHILRDETGIPFPNAISVGGFPEGYFATKALRFGTVPDRQDSNAIGILKAKEKVFRYCALYDGIEFLGRNPPYNGLGEIGGNDFVINMLGEIYRDGNRDDDDVAATFMHELGHTLGLRHGGANDSLGTLGPISMQGKPNYPSIMNYALTHPMRWSRRFWTLDYSREELGTLRENSLDESNGIRSNLYRGYSMPYGTGPDLARRFRLVRLDGRAVDFDSDGVFADPETASREDLNFLPAAAGIAGTQDPSPGDVMHGHNDWANLLYRVVADEREFEHDITIATGCPSSESISYLDAAIPVPCYADFNEDEVLDFFDYLDFVSAFSSGSLLADFNSDQIVDFFDYLDFVLEFANGC